MTLFSLKRTESNTGTAERRAREHLNLELIKKMINDHCNYSINTCVVLVIIAASCTYMVIIINLGKKKRLLSRKRELYDSLKYLRNSIWSRFIRHNKSYNDMMIQLPEKLYKNRCCVKFVNIPDLVEIFYIERTNTFIFIIYFKFYSCGFGVKDCSKNTNTSGNFVILTILCGKFDKTKVMIKTNTSAHNMLHSSLPRQTDLIGLIFMVNIHDAPITHLIKTTPFKSNLLKLRFYELCIKITSKMDMVLGPMYMWSWQNMTMTFYGYDTSSNYLFCDIFSTFLGFWSHF
ncbi:hypothetical protein QTP88_006020 [Uroleucon formosanum]